MHFQSVEKQTDLKTMVELSSHICVKRLFPEHLGVTISLSDPLSFNRLIHIGLMDLVEVYFQANPIMQEEKQKHSKTFQS